MRWRCIMKRWIMLTVTIIAVALPTSVLAKSPIGKVLQGKYSFVGSRVCVQTPYGAPGFNPDNYSLLSSATVRTGHYKGTLQLNKDGTGAFDYKLLQIYHQNLSIGQRPIGESMWSCEVEYFTLSNDTIEVSFFNCAGPGTGSSESGSDYSKMSLEVSSSRDILLLADTDPLIEDLWFLPAGATVRIETERICARTFTAVRVN